jgi:hypothetical protein
MTRPADSTRIGTAVMAALLVACSSPSPNPSAGTSAPSQPATVGGSWVEVQVQPHGGPGDLLIEGLYAGPEGIVVTGHLGGALAELAGGPAPVAWHSSNGSTWSPSFVDALPYAGPHAADRFGAIFENAGKLMAFRTGGSRDFGSFTSLMQSPDGGRSWQSFDGDGGTASGSVITDVARGGQGFVAVGYTAGLIRRPVILVSEDGVDWASPDRQVDFEGGQPYGSFNAVASNGRVLVAGGSTRSELDGGSDGYIWTSTDGLTWTRVDVAAEPEAVVNDLTEFEDGFVAVGATASGPAAWSSSDGLAWEPAHLASLGGVRGATSVTLVTDGLIAVGDGDDHSAVWRSADGRSWEPTGQLSVGPASALFVTALEAGALVVGGSVAPAEPLAWVSPPSIARTPTPEASLPLIASPAPLTGETPGPGATVWPQSVPLPSVTIGDLTRLAGGLGMTCRSGVAAIPDFPLTYWGLYCQAEIRNTKVEVQANYWNADAIGDFTVRAFPIDSAMPPDQPLIDTAMISAVGLPYGGNSFPTDPVAWVRSRLYRAECVHAINCILDDGSIQIVLQFGAYGGADVQITTSYR